MWCMLDELKPFEADFLVKIMERDAKVSWGHETWRN